jgi:hypothetical protein
MKYTAQCPAQSHVTIETNANSLEEALEKMRNGDFKVTDWSMDDPTLEPENLTLEFVDEIPG